jgi:ribose-phosphate pyrophosphokinase
VNLDYDGISINGEVAIEVKEPVRDCEVLVVQSTCPPVDENLIELLALIDCCRRASARKVTAIVPYFGYARADKRRGQQAPITASMVAVMMEAVGREHYIIDRMWSPSRNHDCGDAWPFCAGRA